MNEEKRKRKKERDDDNDEDNDNDRILKCYRAVVAQTEPLLSGDVGLTPTNSPYWKWIWWIYFDDNNNER